MKRNLLVKAAQASRSGHIPSKEMLSNPVVRSDWSMKPSVSVSCVMPSSFSLLTRRPSAGALCLATQSY
jgi:hypothetical protein